MNQQLQVFNHEQFGDVRIIEEDGRVLFCGKDVAKALGYENPRDAIRRHCRGVVKRDGVSKTTNQHGVTTEQVTQMSFIPEGDLYRMITHSKLPAAERFEKWVFDEVLPTIRKTGGYGQPVDMELLTQVIAQTVRITVAELLPYIAQSQRGASVPVRIMDRTSPAAFRRPTIIQRMSAEQRDELTDMIFEGAYSYSAISRYFLDQYGIRMSIATICGYANALKAALL
jgi:prophage antirepressor-like protein|nr:MAG TPA: repressor domain protein [Caudoviricetes sp.]DAO22313.1 MAG TPA: repressor domain protein [Caudoviricetes sp.]